MSLARCLTALTLLSPLPASAGYTLGSSNIAPIEPAIPHPPETPCVVTLVANVVFGGNAAPFSYAPPSACPGPWAKVILTAEIGLDKGIQYDRTGTIFLAGVPLWFGTTSEPSPNNAPHWRIQQDVTDDTTLLLAAQTGNVLIGNYTNSTDTSVITASAQLLFYPATTKFPVPTTPDIVIPVGAPGGGTVALSNSSSVLATPLPLPANVVKARLDLYTQSQSNDEFWYTCVPDSLSSELDSCGGGSFREAEIAVDSTPAGVAPVFPWIYTGGIDPYLWFPMPGVQTLNFKPFPVELTPFAGVLSNGRSHTLNVSVFGADSYFSVTGTFYAWLDKGGTSVTGAITQDTLAATPSPKTTSSSHGDITAVKTSDSRNFTITGTADTSAGKVTTTVHETSTFTNDQSFDITSVLYKQRISQDTETFVQVTQKTGTSSAETDTQYSYPLSVTYNQKQLPAGNYVITTGIAQEYRTTQQNSANGLPVSEYDFTNAITPTDTLLINAAGQLTGNQNQSSKEVLTTYGTNEGCFTRTLTAANNTLTGATTSTNCQ